MISAKSRKATAVINRAFFGNPNALSGPKPKGPYYGTTPFIPPAPQERPNYKRPQAYLKGLDSISTALREAEIPCWLDSGTALGMHRHGGMIPWDHDIDVAVLDPDMPKVYQTLKTKLDPEKYSIQDWSVQSRPCSFLKVFIKGTHDFIDIYPNTYNPETDTIHHKYAYRDHMFTVQKAKEQGKKYEEDGFPAAHIFPLRPCTFDGVETYVPNRLKECLEQQYGDISPCRQYKDGKWVPIKNHKWYQGHYTS